MKKPPFFIVGCVRSGTTFLRDSLRNHPNLASPEETHFFRWAHPYGTDTFRTSLLKNVVLKKHRKIDGISEEEFQSILNKSVSRADLSRKYMKLYIEKNKPYALRWFDKTPQNIYGVNLIASQFPAAKIIHIVRDPIDVISSLRVGKIVKVKNLVGACNYWKEAIESFQILKKVYPGRVHEVKYEEFSAEPIKHLEKILDFLGEKFDPADYSDVVGNPKSYQGSELFTEKELTKIKRLCSRWGKYYGYFED